MADSMNLGRRMNLTNYEMLRLKRIEENNAVMEAMRLPSLVSSLNNLQKNKRREIMCKRKPNDDVEYMPSQKEKEDAEFPDDEEFLDEVFLRRRLDKGIVPEVQRVGSSRSSKRLTLARSSNDHHTDKSTCTEPATDQNTYANDVHDIMTPNEDVNIASVSRQKRGPTRNLGLAKKKAVKQKMAIEIAENEKRIVGEDSKYLIAEGTCVIRKYAPLNVPKWSKLTDVDREPLRKKVVGSFEVKDNTGDAKRVIDAQLNRQYRNYRHNLHREFQKYPNLSEALKHPPDGISIENWDWLCRYFDSPQFQKRSNQNKINRKQATPHTAGTKSFARICHERKTMTGNAPGQIELYEITHKKGETGWVNEDAERNHEQMVQLQSESQVEGDNRLTDEEICIQVLGNKSSFVRAGGYGRKHPSSMYKQYKDELEEYKRRAEQAEQKNIEMQLEINELKEDFKEEMKEYKRIVGEEMKGYKNDTENKFKEILDQLRNSFGATNRL